MIERTLISSLFALSLASCASAPSVEEISNADYGRAMSAGECQEISRETFAVRMKDPGSVQMNFAGDCVKGHSGNVPIAGMSAEFGYLQTGGVNAKNSFGAYTGFKPFYVVMRNGTAVVAAIADGEYGIMIPFRPTLQTVRTPLAPALVGPIEPTQRAALGGSGVNPGRSIGVELTGTPDGILVGQVVSGRPGGKAGLVTGDVITAINGINVVYGDNAAMASVGPAMILGIIQGSPSPIELNLKGKERVHIQPD